MDGDICKKCDTKRRASLGLVHQRDTLRRMLLNERGHQCEICESYEWMGQPVPIELDHIDGNASNNLLSNLRLLCPNCHAMQPTYKGRNRGKGRTSLGLPHY
jgi:hypothetical protein